MICLSLSLSLSFSTVDKSLDDKHVCFSFIFVGVYLPELAMKKDSQFLPIFDGRFSLLSLLYGPCTIVWIIMQLLIMRACTLHNVGHENNVHFHCIAGAVFAYMDNKNKK